MEQAPTTLDLRQDHALATQVRVEQVALLYQYVPVSLVSNVLIAVCVAFSLQGKVAFSSMSYWLAALGAALAVRSLPYVAVRLRPVSASSVARDEWLFTLGACATGSIWGLSFPFLGVGALEEAQRWFAYAILIVSGAGIAAGGVFVMSYRLRPALLFMTSTLLPGLIFFALRGGRDEIFVLVLISIYFGFLSRSCAIASRATLNNMLLRREATASAQAAQASRLQRDAAAEEFRTFATALPDLLLKIDGDGHVLFANENAQMLLGDAATLRTADFGEFVANGGRSAFQSLWAEVEEKGSLRRELVLRTQRGELPYLLSAAAVRATDGEMVALVGVAQDVSSMKAIEAQLAHARDLAEQGSRAKSAFVANMSHEIRTPLNAVIGFSEIAMDQPLPPRIKDYVTNIHRSGTHLLGIVNDVLDFSKIEAGKLELEHAQFDLWETLEAARRQAEVLAQGKSLPIELSRGEGLPRLLGGDPVRLAQILSNLVSNAVKFTQRGRIEIRAEVAQRTGARLTVSLQVRDTGIGMDAGQIERIFQPFTQGDVSTTRRFGGTGLGLTLCKRLVDLMGGQMEVASRVGEGSSFTVRLPFQAVDAPTTPRPAPAESVARDDKFSGRRALLVEDNPINRLVASVMLERIGLRVDVAADGREAVDKIDAAPGHYDVIFMDVQMPNLDGMEATRLIRRQHPSLKLPIIAMTANAFEHDRQDCLAAGMDDFVAKPVTARNVIAALTRCLHPAQPQP